MIRLWAKPIWLAPSSVQAKFSPETIPMGGLSAYLLNHRQPCANAYSLAVGSARGSVLGVGRVASQPRHASQMARGMVFCAVR